MSLEEREGEGGETLETSATSLATKAGNQSGPSLVPVESSWKGFLAECEHLIVERSLSSPAIESFGVERLGCVKQTFSVDK
ncbi:hypothetical protein RRG08_038567 [Elysia crispata]|uniref:Uncharacterized protein n=1 Tax=Elysia crispata TaxID=231223 RepID=A0AAE0YFN8_9GAST|nr:hypothetical protein RRG08_038567 [Elysia crispata]